MGEVKIHYYPHKTGYLKTTCGIEWHDIKDHSADIKWVTCKKCLNKLKKLV